MANQSEPEFGERLRGNYAGKSNPHRDGFYVRTIRRNGRVNPGKWYELTDKKGSFWEYRADQVTFLDRSAVEPNGQ